MPGSCSSLRDLVLVVTAETQRTGRLKCHQEGEARTEGRHGQEGREMPAWGTGPGREPRAPSSRTRSPTDSGQTEPHASRRLEARGRPGSLSAFVQPCFPHVFKSTLGCGVQGGTQVPRGRSALLCGFRGAGMQGGLCQATGSSPQLVVQRRPWKERGQQTACFQV